MKKRFFLLPVLCALLFLNDHVDINAQSLVDETKNNDDQNSSNKNEDYKSGWYYESGIWKYYENGKALEGWHYLPANNDPDNRRWFFFLKDGVLLSDTAFISELSSDSSLLTEKYLESIKGDNKYSISYERDTISDGWHTFLSVKDEDGVSQVKNCCIIRTGLDDYAIFEFSGDKWKALGAGEEGLSFGGNYGSDDQTWNIIKNPDDTYTFINKGTWEMLNFEDGEFSGVSLLSAGTGSKINMSERTEARPEYFGAKGDGETDDSLPVYYAVNNSKTVVFTNRYNTFRTIDIYKDGVTIKGDGGVMVTHPGLRTFWVRGKNITFDSLDFQGNYSEKEATDNSCIFFMTGLNDAPVVDYNAKILNCKFLQTGLRGVHIHSARVSDKDFTPVSIVSGITIKDCVFDTYKIGVCCSGPDNVVVDNCTFSNGFYEHITFDWRSRHCKAINNHFLYGEKGIGAIGVDAAENIEVLNNYFNYTDLYCVSLNNETGTSSNIVVSGNYFKYGGGHGGIQFRGESKYGVAAENVTITNNIFDSEGSESVVIDSAGGTISFSGNTYLSGTPVIKETSADIITDF